MKHCLRVGVGGPVGSGKTALLEVLCKRMRDTRQLAVVTNDIYTREDAQFLIRSQALEEDRILGVETGGCPHTAIREDARGLYVEGRISTEVAKGREVRIVRKGGFKVKQWSGPLNIAPSEIPRT